MSLSLIPFDLTLILEELWYGIAKQNKAVELLLPILQRKKMTRFTLSDKADILHRKIQTIQNTIF